jgi:hypothetical protein
MPKSVACKCPNCGAAISVQPVNGVTRCAYCQGAIQVTPDDQGGVALSIKHINIQGGNVQIADKLTVVHGDTAVTCNFCGKHNLKHNTFRCRQCKIDDLCAKHQTSSGICERCREDQLDRADARRAKERAEAARRQAEATKRQNKIFLIVLASVLGAIVFLCVIVPAMIFVVLPAIAQIPGFVYVIFVALILAIGVIAGTVWYFRNQRREAAAEDEEDAEGEETEDEEVEDAKEERVKEPEWWKESPGH